MKAEKLILFAAVILSAAWLDPYADYVRKGNSAYNEADYKSAVDNYDAASKYLPSKSKAADIAFNKATAYSAKGSNDVAEEHFREALKSEDKEVQKKAFYNLGNMYSRSGDTAKAADAYMNALKIDPDYQNAKNNLENILKQQNKDDKKDDKQNKEDKKDDKQNNKKNDDSKKDQNQDKQNQSDDKSVQGDLSREQIDKILQDYQNMPVKRMKGKDENGVQVLEKNW
ncbi:MAG: tetratricopeptide repeat protein [Spirochaetes bacterium]|nr:tetratricopeptide repeat protein [Spirochaetota bacterium]